MKRFLIVLLALWPMVANAQHYRPAHGSAATVLGDDNLSFYATNLSFGAGENVVTGSTTANFIEAIRVVCTASCFVGLAGTTWQASAVALTNAASGMLLPANTPEILQVRGGEYVIVVGSDTAGTVYIRTLTK